MGIYRIVAVLAVAVAVVGCDGGGNTSGSDVVTTDSTVTINGITWMRYNLNLKTTDSWCYEDNDSNCAKYGRLYTWDAAVSACAGKGNGWKLPDTADWRNLISYAGQNAGKKLRSKSGWSGNNGNGTDNYGFSALPGGGRYEYGSFHSVGTMGLWWTAFGHGDGEFAHSQVISAVDVQWGNKGDVFESGNYRSRGLSVRCVIRD